MRGRRTWGCAAGRAKGRWGLLTAGRTCFVREHSADLLLPPAVRLQMVFGQAPPPLSEDAVARQPCLAACPSGAAAPLAGAAGAQAPRCHKLD